MLVIVGLVAVVVAGLFGIGLVLALVELLRRLVRLAVRVAASGGAALAGGAVVVGALPLGGAWLAIPVALALAVFVWRRTRAPQTQTQTQTQMQPPPRDASRPGRRFGTARAAVGPPPLLSEDLRERLRATEAALVDAARDEPGGPAGEWLTFCRRRVPDLIASARDVHTGADDAEKASVAARLAGHLDGIIAEADRRVGAVRDARRDLFATRGAHADQRVRDG